MKTKKLVQMGDTKEEGGAVITLGQPSVGPSQGQTIRLDPLRGFTIPLTRKPCQFLFILKSQCSEVDWSNPIQSCSNR